MAENLAEDLTEKVIVLLQQRLVNFQGEPIIVAHGRK